MLLNAKGLICKDELTFLHKQFTQRTVIHYTVHSVLIKQYLWLVTILLPFFYACHYGSVQVFESVSFNNTASY